VAEIHGKSAILYLGAAGAAAIQIGEQIDWSIDMDMAVVDSTPLGNTWKQFVKGLMGYNLSFQGNFDTASTQIFLAATSAVAEKWYLYPQGTSSTYYYGTAWIQLQKVAAGSTTTKASSSFKGTGQGTLSAQ
jgi:hypothetical protein